MHITFFNYFKAVKNCTEHGDAHEIRWAMPIQVFCRLQHASSQNVHQWHVACFFVTLPATHLTVGQSVTAAFIYNRFMMPVGTCNLAIRD
jgi:hypothetical protein